MDSDSARVKSLWVGIGVRTRAESPRSRRRPPRPRARSPAAPAVLARPGPVGGVELVLFDMDDTVFDHAYSVRVGLAALRRVHPFLASPSLDALVARYQLLLDEVHPSVLAGRITHDEARLERMSRLSAWTGGAVDRAQAAEMSAAYRAAYQRGRRPVPGVVEVLARLGPVARLGIVSNNQRREQQDKLEALGMNDRFDFVLTSEEARVEKPDPRIYRMALRRGRAHAERSVMVGDSWAWDVVGARAAGLRAVWLNRSHLAVPEPLGVPVLRSFRPPPSAIRAILQSPPI